MNKEQIEVRRPMVAGSFYPANPIELSKQVAEFFSKAQRRPLAGPVKPFI